MFRKKRKKIKVHSLFIRNTPFLPLQKLTLNLQDQVLGVFHIIYVTLDR